MKIHQVPWVIVQAGGQGTRLEHLTWNKPKCLVAVSGKPLLYHLFDRFPAANFIVIGDYRYEVLETYLAAIAPPVSVHLIRASTPGTLGGVKAALQQIPDSTLPFLLIWSDLLLEQLPDVELGDRPLLGLSRSFSCRWSYDPSTGSCVHERSNEHGIAGFFLFPNQRDWQEVPEGGECVRWLSQQPIPFQPLYLDDMYELGTITALKEYQQRHVFCRFYNKVTIAGDRVIKQASLPDFQHLIAKELNWYRTVQPLGFQRIPQLLAESPLTLSRIPGLHPFELDLQPAEQVKILEDIFQHLETLHQLAQIPADQTIVREVYLDKTRDRVQSITKLLPDGHRSEFRVNGNWCRNPFHLDHESWFAELVNHIPVDQFVLFHGDPTFSNTLIDPEGQPWWIDPRGYFSSKLLLYGDAKYDWAKLYYSVVGEYDHFNRRNFKLTCSSQEITIDIQSAGWSHLEPVFTDRFRTEVRSIRLIHALIWLAMSGCAQDDYDSVLCAFYNGLFWLERAIA